MGAVTTSCEDMMTPDNHLVTTDLAPQDTLYQMMGIVKRMQMLADRTILLGEIRADLVEVDPARASADLQELANNNVSTTNAYNSPAEYYAVINSCNIYLNNVDSLYKVYGEYYYQKEVIAAKCFRAWCYLELAKIYGSVPFTTEPVLSADAADRLVASADKKDMLAILDFSIQDLLPYAYLSENSELRPSYGATFSGVNARNIFLPVRALLGELYLWRGSVKGKDAGIDDFKAAAGMYHDYLCYPGEEKSVEYNAIEWTSSSWQSPIYNSISTYSSNNFGLNSQNAYAAVLPLDTAAYYGTTSDLRAVFNSTYSNNYYPSVVPSKRMSDISKAQKNLFVTWKKTNVGGAVQTEIVRAYAPSDAATLGSEKLIGDLRYADVYRTNSNISESRYNSNVNSTKHFITKWLGGETSVSDDRRQTYIIYYRTNTLYLHMAEALNLAGFPETAFAVLSRGLTYSVLNSDTVHVNQHITKADGTEKDTVIALRVVSDDEFDRLCEIKTKGYTNTTSDFEGDPEKSAKAANSFVVWKSDVFWNLPKLDNNRRGSNGTMGSWKSNSSAPLNSKTQIGIHSIGSGDTEFNEYYQLDDEDTRNQLLQGVQPDTPEGGYNGEDGMLSFDDWREITTKAKTNANYNAYVEAYNKYPTLQSNYETDKTFLTSAALRAKRQAHVSWLILEEEALEGSYEGHRFYDILRYQMQNGKVSGPSATIEMPDSITKLYGPTSNMTGKPWYLTLPNR